MAKKQYRTYGSEAYAPERSPERSPRPPQKRPSKPQAMPQGRTSVRPLHRKRVEVREAGVISIDAICGFVLCITIAAILMSAFAELASTSDQVVQLRSQLSSLQSQQQILSAQYEKHFDIARIEETLGNELIRPTNEQMVYIDLSQPDSVQMFGMEKNGDSFFHILWNLIFK